MAFAHASAPASPGGVSLLANRALSGVSAVADASSSQSRTDVLCLALSACLLLTGLQWASLKSRDPKRVGTPMRTHATHTSPHVVMTAVFPGCFTQVHTVGRQHPKGKRVRVSHRSASTCAPCWQVALVGEEVSFKHPDLDDALTAELQW